MEIGELVAVSVGSFFEHDESCPFCKKTEPPAQPPVSKEEDDLAEDPDKELIDNASGELDRNMKKAGRERPQDWYIDLTAVGGEANHKVTANPHHLIPGNESLKEAEKLLPWIFGAKGVIENDIGYNVNNAENGVWLPSNNSMRKKAKWDDPDFKGAFVVAAMDRANAHFHDRHGKPYSEAVTKILNKIANRLNRVDSENDCPYQPENGSEGRYKPPYALIDRLNGISKRISGYLHLSSDAPPQASFYTSRLVLWYWMKKKGFTDARRLITDATGKLRTDRKGA